MHSINDSLEQCRFHKGKTTLKSFLSFQAMVSKKWRIENTEAFENLCLKFCYSVASFNEFKFENNKNKSKIAGDKSNQLAKKSKKSGTSSFKRFTFNSLFKMEELDSTMALLSSELKCGGEYNSALIKEAKNKMKKPTVHVDSEEDEIFFGEKTDKEKFGMNSK